MTITAATSDKLTFSIGNGADSAAAKKAANSDSDAGNINDKLGLSKPLAVTGEAPSASSVRTALVKQFNDLRTQIDQLAKDASLTASTC